ncbi:MAG: molybdenum cofactor biosynthesis protein MoaE [Candidatus Bathyarchaeia archaeon]
MGSLLMEKVGIHGLNKVSMELILKDIHSNPSANRAGAIACFIGIVREFSHAGDKVEDLKYQAYEDKAVEVMSRIREDVCRKEGIVDVHIHHVVGDKFTIGDEVLYVAVAGRSRSDVFPVLEETVQRVKKEVPIYKKEKLTDGTTYWVAEDFHKPSP